jgi:hypothetical protein
MGGKFCYIMNKHKMWATYPIVSGGMGVAEYAGSSAPPTEPTIGALVFCFPCGCQRGIASAALLATAL